MRIAFLLLLLTAFFMRATYAQSPSASQIEQFKKLPRDQQVAIADRLGINLNDIMMSQAGSSESEEGIDGQVPSNMVFPRGTEFDAFGNPIIAEDSDEQQDESNQPKELVLFGKDLFANAPSSFTARMDVSVPDSYILGVGDELTINIFGKQSFSVRESITGNGEIFIPEVGPHNLAGMTLAEAKTLIRQKVEESIIGVDLSVSLSSIRSMRVFVLGEAYKPGAYTLSSLSTITHALFAAGGISDIGSLRTIQLKREGKIVVEFDLYDLLLNGDSSKDVTLKPNDVIFVPTLTRTVTIDGEIRRPAIYEIKSTESFNDALALAGGLLPNAFSRSVTIERFNKDYVKTIITADLSGPEANQLVEAGDVVFIPMASEQVGNSVTLIGAVSRPGKYQWNDQKTIIDLLPEGSAPLLDEADYTYGLIVREDAKTRSIKTLQFSLVDIYAGESPPVLMPKDIVLIFDRYEKVSDQSARLSSLAFTEAKLIENEKERVKQVFEDELYWEYFAGEEGSLYARRSSEESDDELVAVNQTLIDLSDDEEDSDILDYRIFSRKRLMAPVVNQLKGQGNLGEPIMLVELTGEVRYPGLYPLTENMTVKELILAGGGLKESAYLAKSEITRIGTDQNLYSTVSHIAFDLGNILRGASDSLELKSKDRLIIHKKPEWQENRTVQLRGEFVFPGEYTIQRGETLMQLIERAGGLTKFADPMAAVFSRDRLKQIERQNLLKLSSDLRVEIASKSLVENDGLIANYDQAKKLLNDITKIDPLGRLVIELDQIIDGKADDINLDKGDVLYVPEHRSSINVVGQVQLASSHLFNDGLSIDDYIRLSGGLKKQADDSRIYVIKSNGAVVFPDSSYWFSNNDDSQMSKGDTIVVPLDSSYMDNLTLWSTATQIIYQTAVAIAAISGI